MGFGLWVCFFQVFQLVGMWQWVILFSGLLYLVVWIVTSFFAPDFTICAPPLVKLRVCLLYLFKEVVSWYLALQSLPFPYFCPDCAVSLPCNFPGSLRCSSGFLSDLILSFGAGVGRWSFPGLWCLPGTGLRWCPHGLLCPISSFTGFRDFRIDLNISAELIGCLKAIVMGPLAHFMISVATSTSLSCETTLGGCWCRVQRTWCFCYL